MGNEAKGRALGVSGVFFRSPDPAGLAGWDKDDLDAALDNVQAAGGQVVPEKEEHDFGRFGWIVDPDGNRVELWEPPEKMPEQDG